MPPGSHQSPHPRSSRALRVVNSRLYTGRVSHHRSRPKKNAFSYNIYYLYVDLDELDDLDAEFYEPEE